MFDLGLDKLRSDIDSEHSCISVKALCQCSEDKTEFLSLQSAYPLDDITTNFNIMMSSQSILFQSIWKKHMAGAIAAVERKERAELTIEDIKTVLWEPAFKECNYLLDALHDRSIKLSEADSYFKDIQEEMTDQIQKLNFAVHKCVNPHEDVNVLWIDDAVQHIQDYWSLLTLSDQANEVMVLRTKLKLNDGNFEAIQTIASQVSYFMIMSSYQYCKE